MRAMCGFAGRDVTRCPRRRGRGMGLARTFQISSLAMDYTVLQNAMLGALGRAATCSASSTA